MVIIPSWFRLLEYCKEHSYGGWDEPLRNAEVGLSSVYSLKISFHSLMKNHSGVREEGCSVRNVDAFRTLNRALRLDGDLLCW